MTAWIPEEVEAAGRRWRVRRAWPAAAVDGAGAVDLEVSSPGIAGVRAGRWSAANGAGVNPEPVDARLPALRAVAAEGVVVSLRAGRRGVVRTSDGRSYVKVARHAARVRATHERAAAFSSGFALPGIVGQAGDEELGIVRFTALPGRTLHEIGADRDAPNDRVRRAWHAWANGWLSTLAADGADLPEHTASDEAGVLRGWVARAVSASPALAPATGSETDALPARAIRAAERRVADTLAAGTPTRVAVSHRDLHDKQVLWDEDAGPGLLDLDTASRAEVALDLGNLRAHVAFRVAQGMLDEERARIATTAIDGVADRAGADAARVAAYESATRLRLGCLYLFRPAWHSVALRWLAAECLPAGR